MTETIARTVTVDGNRLQVRLIAAHVDQDRSDPYSYSAARDANEDVLRADAAVTPAEVWTYYLDMLGRRAFGTAYDGATSRTDAWAEDGSYTRMEVTLHRAPRRGDTMHSVQNVWATWDRAELASAAEVVTAYRQAER
jgi:hypothetical protein